MIRSFLVPEPMNTATRSKNARPKRKSTHSNTVLKYRVDSKNYSINQMLNTLISLEQLKRDIKRQLSTFGVRFFNVDSSTRALIMAGILLMTRHFSLMIK